MIQFNGINHLAMVTPDMDETIRFWRDLLGLRLVAGLGNPGYRHYFFEISKYDMIAFFEWTGVEPLAEKDHGAPVKGSIAFDHVSFGVDTLDSLWELKDKLEAAGFWASEVVDHGFIYSLYSFDPHNIPLEFSFNVAGAEIRSNPVMADSNPSTITREGPEPHPGRWPEVTNETPEEERRIYPGAGSELFHGLARRAVDKQE
ncbi:MAG TPA: VOC family protein [Desulfomonilaceae bacterium]|nr:VOC family protein [Desulfomonilaceae bacterium]